MRAVRSFFIAVSLYSKIPVPQFSWNEEDMQYVFCFFPWIGAAIGGLLYLWNGLCGRYQIGALCRTAAGLAIPLLLTGGFHADGFLDTMDALHSYRPKEEKLRILKDSRIGAFAVISFAVYGLVFCGAFSEITDDAFFQIFCAGFFLSRCLCGLGAVSFPLAKKEGMLFQTAGSSRKMFVKGTLYVQGALCIGWMCRLLWPAGLFAAEAGIASFFYYFYRSRKEFGGVTGDTAGYFVLHCEGCIAVATAFLNIIWRN